jgi:hypothetical protein
MSQPKMRNTFSKVLTLKAGTKKLAGNKEFLGFFLVGVLTVEPKT